MTTESQAAFARRMESVMGRTVNRSTVSRWAEAGKIVMVGGLVDVEKSIPLLQALQGGRSDVSDRHAQEHAEKASHGNPGANDAGNSAGGTSPEPDIRMETARRVKAVSEARIKHEEAEMRVMERKKMEGSLVAKEDADYALDNYGATLRSLLDSLPDRWAPVIHPLQTLEEVHAALSEAAERVLMDMHDALQQKAREHAQ